MDIHRLFFLKVGGKVKQILPKIWGREGGGMLLIKVFVVVVMHALQMSKSAFWVRGTVAEPI